MDIDAYQSVIEIEGLEGRVFKTPGAGKTSKPFRVAEHDEWGLSLGTSAGGRVKVRAAAFEAALKYLSDFGCRGDSWLPVSDMGFQDLMRFENDQKACGSYVLPLLEAAGLVEIERKRPARVRLRARE